MKFSKKIISIGLACVLIFPIFSLTAFANQKYIKENTSKEEVVYVNLNENGSIKEVNVVNIFDLDEAGDIVDYGDYEKLRNMTTNDKIEYKDDVVTIKSDEGKIYYEGKTKENEIPWDITIKYFLNGREYPADKILGKNGNLEIKMDIRKNKNCDSSFFEGYALQTTFLFDTKKASDIKAEGATIANVGSKKQLTYTILPNNEKEISITANVKDFEMDKIAINGVRMNLDIELDDELLQEKIDEAFGAVNNLTGGVNQLADGTDSIYDATGKLNTAANDLSKGVDSLKQGSIELNNGLNTIVSKNYELTSGAWTAFEGMCRASQEGLNAKLTANGLETVTLTPSNYSDVLLGILSKMDAEAAYQKAYNEALKKVTAEVDAKADTLYKEYIKSQENAIYSNYIQSQGNELYAKAATQIVLKELVESGKFNEEEGTIYLQTEEGKSLINKAIEMMSEEQKSQVINEAILNLSEEQKRQIIKGAESSLTDEQKSEIRNNYIEQMMASDEVTSQINEAIKPISQSASEVSALKGQLDSFKVFYQGLVNYTNVVSSATVGSNTLKEGIQSLSNNTSSFKKAINDLHNAVGKLLGGTNQLKEGTDKFTSETSNMDEKVKDEINKVASSMTGENIKTKSFASEKNTNIKSVQFVIQTEGIKKDDKVKGSDKEKEELSFLEKILNLFGL